MDLGEALGYSFCSFWVLSPSWRDFRLNVLGADAAQEPEEGAAADKPSSKPKGFHTFSYDVHGFSDRNENSTMRHHSLHAEPPRLQCCTCGVESPLQSSLTAHGLCRDSASPYQCDMCSRRFDTTVLVENHPHSHTREQPFACGSGGNSFCDKAGVTRYEEITHVGRRADQLSPAPCVRRVVPTNCTSGHGPQEVLQVPAPPGCCGETDRQGASFQDAPAAQSSVGACSSRPADNKQNAEEDETSTPPKLIHTFLCDDCDYTTRNENFLIRHRRAHVETNSLLQCHVCNEEFPQLALLEAHTPSHLTARPYMCDVCGARFQNLTNVKDHVRKHTRERPFACKVCGRTFVYRSSWISHAKTHPEQRPFACHLCPETFLLKRSLKDHYMKQHTNKQ